MRRITMTVAATALGLSTLAAQNPGADLQRALQNLAANGDCKAAIEVLQTIAARAGSNRAVAAQAEAKIAECRALLDRAPSPLPFPAVPPDTRLQLDSIASPDGLLALEGQATVGLTVRELSTGRQRMLVRSEPNSGPSSPVWSLDSKRVAYVWGRNGARPASNPPPLEVRVIDVTGGAAVTVFSRGVFFGRINLWAWTSKNELVYSVRTFDEIQRGERTVPFFVIPANVNAAPRGIGRLDDTDDRVGNPTPDGRSFVVVSNEHLALVDLSTGTQQSISSAIGPAYPQLSPDGQLLVYLARRDGQWGVYAVPFGEDVTRRGVRVAALQQRSSGVPQIMPGFRLKGQAVRWIAPTAVAVNYTEQQSNLYRLDIGPGPQRTGVPLRLTRNVDARTPVVSPDSRRILFSTSSTKETPDYGLLLIGADGTGERRLVERPGTVPVFVDDAVNGARRTYDWVDNERILYSLPNQAGLVTRVVAGRDEQSPAALKELNPLLPNPNPEQGRRNEEFQYVAARNELFYRSANLVNGGFQQILAARSAADGADRVVIRDLGSGWSVSPDGRHVAAWMRGSAPTANKGVLQLFSTTDGASRALLTQSTESIRALAWAPDSRKLLYGLRDDVPSVIDVETGETSALGTQPLSSFFEPGQTLRTEGWAWAPDGSFLVFSARTSETSRLAWSGVTVDAVRKLAGSRDGRE